ncbi:MAG: response regulator [Eubacteriales bacterium]
MQKVRVLVTSEREVIRGGLAQILNSADNLEVVGREGADILEEAYELQPDLLVHRLFSTDDGEYNLLEKVKSLCKWTKIIIFTVRPLNRENLKKFLGICNGYFQGPILPDFFLRAVELVCYSGYFFFLGSSKDIKPEIKDEVQNALPVNFLGGN